jgi:3'-5' exoribonuclease
MHPADLLPLADLRTVANAMLQPYRVHVQLDSLTERTTSTGSPYLEARLVDATDSLLWRLFDNNPCFHQLKDLPRSAFIELDAEWIDTGKYGIEPRSPKVRLLSEDEKQSLLLGDPETAARQQSDWHTILEKLASLSDPRLHHLCQLFLDRFADRYKRTAAARENHHARRGGLVEHVAQMMRASDALCAVYPDLNRDLLIAGILFHDCGKMWENSYPETGFSQPYNLHGEMLGHIPLGLELVNKLWRDLMDLPEATDWTLLDPNSEHVRLHLLHLVAAHHGQLEFGSPVLPKTPEAIALHHIDNIDAKLEMFRRGYQTAKELAPHIYDRFRPWPTRIVSPLKSIPPPPPAEETPGPESPPTTDTPNPEPNSPQL